MAEILRGLDVSMLLDWVMIGVAILICLTIHELAHGLTAYALGDDTAKRMGRLTLNPLRHVDPIGFIMLMVARFGWAKPVPVDMRNFKRPKYYMALTALAGPASNFLLTILILLFWVPLLRLRGDGGQVAFYVAELIIQVSLISTFLGIFNLLPVPPLDGSKILFAVLRDRHYGLLMRYEHYGMFLLFGVVFLNWQTGFLSTALWAVYSWMAGWTREVSMFLFL